MESSYVAFEGFRANPDPSIEKSKQGPVYLVENGWPTHVLLNYEDYAAMVWVARLPDLRMDQLMISFDDNLADRPLDPEPRTI